MSLHDVADDDDAVPADVNQYRTLLQSMDVGEVLTGQGVGSDPVGAAPTPPLELTDGTHDLTGVSKVTVTGAVVGGTADAATLTVTGAPVATTSTDGVVKVTNNMAGDPVALTTADAAAFVLASEVGVAGGVAELDANTHALQQPVYDATEASTLDTLGSSSTVVNNLNRMRHQLATLVGGAWDAAVAMIPLSQKGAASGVADLDSGSHVPLTRLAGLTHSQLDAAAGITAGQIASVNPSALTGSGTVPDAALPNEVSAGTSAYPSSVTVDAKGRVTAITAGSAPTAAFSWVTKTTNYTITSSDAGIEVDASGGDVTITLPTAVGVTQLFAIKRTDSGVHAVSILTTSAQTIDGLTTVPLRKQNQGYIIGSDGTNWGVYATFLPSPLTTLGDIVVADSNGLPARHAHGANGTFLGVSGGAVGYYTPATGAWELTDGTTDLTDVTKVTVSGATVGGSSAAATLTISGGTGAGELLMQDGVSAPPVPIETDDQTDWLYAG